MFKIKRYLKRDIVREKMIAKNILTIKELSQKIDVSVQYLSQVLREIEPINISEKIAVKISNVLDCDVNEIIQIV